MKLTERQFFRHIQQEPVLYLRGNWSPKFFGGIGFPLNNCPIVVCGTWVSSN